MLSSNIRGDRDSSDQHSMKPSTKKVLFRVAFLLVWVFGGAWIFKRVEEKENDGRSMNDQMKELYRSKSSELNMTFAEFKNLSAAISKLLTASRKRWTYKNAVEFSFHTVTTIGYGYITPTTPSGQVLCILYALIGIPVSMLALKSVGAAIMAGFTVIIRVVEKRLWKTAEPQYVEVKCTVVTFLTTIVFLIITVVIQVHIECMTYIEGTYLWVISLTTIGYGDYYPGKKINLKNLSQSSIVFVEIFGILFYIVGLCFVSSVLNSIASAMEKRRCCGRCSQCTCLPEKLQINRYHPESVEVSDDQLQIESTKHLNAINKYHPGSAVETCNEELEINGAKHLDRDFKNKKIGNEGKAKMISTV